MAIITQSDNSSNRFEFETLDIYEFIPFVQIKDPKNTEGIEKVFESGTGIIQLSPHLDKDKRSLEYTEINTKSSTLKMCFTVSKGSSNSWDEDGYIESKLSIDESIAKITTNTKILTKYGTDINIELKINSKEKIKFFIDFYANDNEDYFKGDYENIFCGRIEVRYKPPCVCQDDDWRNVPRMVTEIEKVKYGKTPIPWTQDTPECYHYALHQLKVLGFWLKSTRWNKNWGSTKEINDYIYQLHLDSDVAGMKKGAQKDMFKKSLIYLKEAMKTKTPVMVGLDYHGGYANEDLITDHFAVITGCGKDSNGKLYFDVTDNAFDYQKYYCNCEDYEIRSEDNEVIISQVRESKKL